MSGRRQILNGQPQVPKRDAMLFEQDAAAIIRAAVASVRKKQRERTQSRIKEKHAKEKKKKKKKRKMSAEARAKVRRAKTMARLAKNEED